jgi:hypothetical protein
MSEQVDIFVKELLRSNLAGRNTGINISERSKHLGLDISGYLGFSYALNLQTSHLSLFGSCNDDRELAF